MDAHELSQALEQIAFYKETQHYFTPSKDSNMFCDKCGEYLTDEIHFREPPQPPEGD